MSYRLSIPTQNQQEISVGSSCFPKPNGNSEVDVAPSAFGFPGVPFDIALHASAGPAPGQVELTSMLSPGACVNVQGHAVKILGVTGKLTLAVTPLATLTTGAACGAGMESNDAFAQTGGDAENEFRFHVRDGCGDFGLESDVVLDRFTLTGDFETVAPIPLVAAIRDVHLRQTAFCSTSPNALTIQGRVDLTAGAPPAGFPVLLSTSGGAVTPPSLSVAAGSASASFSLTLPPGFVGDAEVVASNGSQSARAFVGVGGLMCTRRVPVFRPPPYFIHPGDPAQDRFTQAMSAIFAAKSSRLALIDTPTRQARIVAPVRR
jgi:hypothetical protein